MSRAIERAIARAGRFGRRAGAGAVTTTTTDATRAWSPVVERSDAPGRRTSSSPARDGGVARAARARWTSARACAWGVGATRGFAASGTARDGGGSGDGGSGDGDDGGSGDGTDWDGLFDDDAWYERGITVRGGSAIDHASGGALALNALRDADGARKARKRVGRGIGSGKGKTSGRGHKGAKSRSGGGPRLGFEGGQTPLRLTLPKRGAHNPHRMTFDVVNLATLREYVEAGRFGEYDGDNPRTLTMKDFVDAGLSNKKIKHGIKLLAGGVDADEAFIKVRLEVSRASTKAKEIVERAGGSVTKVHYNRLGLRALLHPHKFPRGLPKPARTPPRLRKFVDREGTLPAPAQMETSA